MYFCFIGPQLTERQTRSVSATTLFLQGLRATRKLLVGARKTHSEDRFEIYEKHGSKYTAVREFYSLHPRDVKRVELNQDIHLISGVIGDRHILLIDNGIDANAVIEIVNHNAKQLFEKWDQSGTYGNRIIYKQWYK